MWNKSLLSVVAFVLILGSVAQAARDVTSPLDTIVGEPDDGLTTGGNDNGWPPNELPPFAVDNQILTKYLHFKGNLEPTGLRLTLAAGPALVTGLSFTTANDGEPRDPVEYELSGSNESISGPWTLIATGPIVDFNGAAAWPRRTKNTTPIHFENDVAYEHYKLMFPTIRDAANANSMQIAEIELLADVLKATAPEPADGTAGVVMPLLTWTPGDTAVYENIYFGTTPELTEANRVASMQPIITHMYYHLAGLESGATYYWRVDEVESDMATVQTGDVWSFTASPVKAYSPSPRDGDKWIDLNIELSWLPGKNATGHDLYFGTDLAAVEARDASVSKGSLIAARYTPDALAEDTTYYWVVDETGAAPQAGDVWSFTTVGGGGGLKGEYFSNTSLSGMPVLTRIDPDVNFNWAGEGPGEPLQANGWSARWTADLEIPVADTVTFAVTSEGGTRLWIDDELVIDMWVSWVATTYASPPMYLEKGIHSLRLEFADWDRNAQQELYWETATMERQIIPAGPLQPPLRARAMYPQNDVVDVPQDVTLMWGAGENAATHQIYFGDDANAVANATPADTAVYRGQQALDQTTYVLTGLEWNKEYFWRIDEVNDAEADSPWAGSVWSFTTADFIVVDDFDSYTNEVGNRVFQTWVDGLGFSEPVETPGNGSGAIVGHDIWSPGGVHYDGQILETVDVHGGVGALPLYFDNSATPFFSEAERTWTVAQDWTVNGVTDLSLWFKGAPAAFVQTGADSFMLSASGADIWGTADECRYVYKSLNGNGSITVRVDSIQNTNGWAKGGAMIRESLDPSSKLVMAVVSPANGVQFSWRDFTSGDMSEHNTQGGLSAPHWVRLTRTGNTFKAEQSADGVSWQPVVDTASNTHETIMVSSVYIGVALTSHDAALVNAAEFSGVQTSGSVSGQWQVAEVGGVHPSNGPADVYVALEDTLGRTAAVQYTGGSNVNEWTRWKIPLADFAGVSTGAVRKMYVGVGNRTVPIADGSGAILVDDIHVVKPEEEPNDVGQ